MNFRLKLAQLVRNLLITIIIIIPLSYNQGSGKMGEGCTVKRHRWYVDLSGHIFRLQDQGDPALGTLIRRLGEPDGPVCGVHCTSSRHCSSDWLHTWSNLVPRHLIAAIVTLWVLSLRGPPYSSIPWNWVGISKIKRINFIKQKLMK